MTGVLEFRNENEFGSYPLSAPVQDNDLILDCGFTSFDGFVPVLKSYRVESGVVKIAIKLESGVATIDIANTVPVGTKVTITLDRYYGYIVLGPGLDRLRRAEVAKTVVCNVQFLPTRVVWIASDSGVFSLDGMKGRITLVPTEQVTTVWSGQNLNFSAIGIPSNKEKIVLASNSSLVYGCTSEKKLMQIDVQTGGTALLTDLDQVYTCMAATITGKLYGVAGHILYDLNQIPGVPVMTLVQGVNGLHGAADGTLYGTGTGLVVIDPVARTETLRGLLNNLVAGGYPQPLICTGDLTQGGNSDTLLMTLSGTFLSGVSPEGGPQPGDTPHYTSDMLARYSISGNTLTIIGNISAQVPTATNDRVVGCYSLVYTTSTLFGQYYYADPAANPDITANVLISLDTNLAVGSIVTVSALDTNIGFLYGATVGHNAEIIVNNFNALKTLNGVAAVGNAIVVEDSELMKLVNTGAGELTVGLPETDELQISHAIQYNAVP